MLDKKIFALLLIAIMLVGSMAFINYLDMHTNPACKSTLGEFKKSKVFVDSALLKSSNKEQIVLVLFKDETSMLRALPKLEAVKGIHILHKYKIIPAVLIRGKPNDVLKLDIEGRFVAGYYSNRKYRIADAKPVEDVGIMQMPPTTTNSTNTTGATAFWDAGYNGTGIVVCVIDTGIDAEHPELSGKVVYAKSFVKAIYGFGTDIDDPSDGNGHGTAVAGIIAGRGLDPRGQGMAPGALLMNARVFPPGEVPTTLAAIIAAIEWATFGEDGAPNTGDEADVINMSLGGGSIYNSPVWLAIRAAVGYGVTVVVAAGNEGDGGRASLSIGDPADAPEAIAVGATDPFYNDMHIAYTSIGPTILRAVKPEVSAPSGVIVLDYQTNGYTDRPWSGTSFSSPHTAGAAALIAQYLSSKGVPKGAWPSIIRTVLMKTARPIGTYEDMIIGSGAIDLRAALSLLESATITGSTYPQWISVLPTKMPVGIGGGNLVERKPYFPYLDRLFNGQHLMFNISISVTKNTTLNITLVGDIANVFTLYTPTIINAHTPVTYWEFNATVNEDAPEGQYSGAIRIEDIDYGVTVEIPMEFKIVHPRAHLLLDLRHTDWGIDQRYGQYRLFVRAMEVLHNVCVEEWLFGYPELTYDVLSKYDIVVAPDTASLIYYYYDNGTPSYWETLDFTPSEIEAIRSYVENGGVFLIFALDAITVEGGVTYVVHNVTNINEILAGTGISLVEADIQLRGSPVTAHTQGNHMLIRDIPTLPYYGIKLEVDPEAADVFLVYGDNKLAAVYQYANGGAFIATGTNFIFDNWAFLGVYGGTGDGDYIYNFVSNLIDFALYGTNVVNVSVSSTAITLGDTVEVTVVNNTPIESISWKVVSKYYEESGVLSYNPNAGNWAGGIEVGIAGTVYVVLTVQLTDGSVVEPIVRLSVAPSETNPPTIVLTKYENMSKIAVSKNQTVYLILNISDDTSVVTRSVSVKLNVSKYSYEVIGSGKLVIVNITIPYESIGGYIKEYGNATVSITISALDVNMNMAQKTYIMIFVPPKPFPITLAIAIIGIILVVVVVVILLRKRKS